MEKKQGKGVMTITIGIICYVLMVVMFMQFKVINETDITSIETMRKSELTTELANWKQKYEETEKKYEEVQSKLNEYRNSQKTSEESQSLLEDELNQVNMILGKNDVEGGGIVITIKDETQNEMGETIKIKADDLLTIVNSLKQAGAEAISINEERIINSTDIVYIQEKFIKVNQKTIKAPYVIKAIGNQAYLESALVGNGGYIDELKKIGHDITIDKEAKMVINKYDGDINVKYMQ